MADHKDKEDLVKDHKDKEELVAEVKEDLVAEVKDLELAVNAEVTLAIHKANKANETRIERHQKPTDKIAKDSFLFI